MSELLTRSNPMVSTPMGCNPNGRPSRLRTPKRDHSKSRIEFSRAGQRYKARFAGEATFVFGDTKEEAEKRLRVNR